MPVVDWLKQLLYTKTQDFVIVPLAEQHGAPRPGPVKVDNAYVTVRIKAARIVDVRRWASKFHGCVNSRARFLHEALGNVEHQTVLVPPELKDTDSANVDRIVSIDKVLLGPFPYRGQLDLTIALFSVKSADLATPYLELLTSLADTAGVAFLAAAKPYIEPLRKGADLLFGTAGASQIEIGFDRDFTALQTGYYLAMRAPKGSVKVNDLRLDPNDYRLLDPRGRPFGTYPYFVVAIETAAQRPDWMLIPDLKETWDAIKTAFVAGQFKDAGNLLSQFERQCRVSADLIPADANRLTNKARGTFVQQEPQGARSFGMRPGQESTNARRTAATAFPGFAELGLYD